MWTEVETKTILPEGKRLITPNSYKTFSLNEENLAAIINAAPHENNKSVKDSETILEIPLSDGTTEAFRIIQYDMAEPGFYEQFPEIKTLYGRGKKNPLNRIRLDQTAAGFRAMLRIEGKGQAFIDPYAQGDTKHYVSYFRKDYPQPDTPFQCGVSDDFQEKLPELTTAVAKAGDCGFRSYRLAMAVTGEYSNYFGVTDNSGEATIAAEVVNSVNRVNEVFENDFGVRLILIANTATAFYYDGATDPYTNNSGSTMLGENASNLNEVIGNSNFDIGHVYSTGGGGIAQLYSPCTSNKSRGVTGLFAPTGDPFWIDYVAHEIGHQFGGNHTQNNSCQRSSQSYEPGSASTIMGYAGICAPNVQNNSDPYFHAATIAEVANFVTGSGNTCATAVSTSNSQPTANAGADYTIPKSTPFVLTATGTDPNPGDVLTYCWEQYDNAVATMPPPATNTAGPAFRSFNPTTDNQRWFPKLSNVLAGTSDQWEVLPSVSRTMNFRVTVRDNSSGAAGCTEEDDMTVTVDGSAGPFVVTSPSSTGVTWFEGESKTVTWDVAGTNAGAVNCPNVDILLSTDGGLTYPVTLASGVNNDGSHLVTVPSDNTTTSARVMVRGNGNIFYDISNNNFEIAPAVSTFTIEVTPAVKQICQGDNIVFTVNTNAVGGFSGNITLSALNVPAGVSAVFADNTVSAGNTTTLTISNTNAASTGNFLMTVSGSNSPTTRNEQISLSINPVPPAVALNSPANNAADASSAPDYQWTAGAGVTDYRIQVASDNSFNNIISDATVQDTAYATRNVLQTSTTYYWRVKAELPCESAWSSVRSFTTGNCLTLNSSTAVAISPDGSPTITSVQSVTQGGTIESVAVNKMQGTHTYISDLSVSLIAPDNTTVNLFNSRCGSADDFNIGFSDGASTSVSSAPCSPLGGTGGIYRPTGSLADFSGKTATGDWTLRIQDQANQDGGELQYWSLELCLAAALPVELLEFTATPQVKDIRLDWITSFEENNSSFQIERRAEFEENFKETAQVSATEIPTDRNIYDFTDTEVKAGVTYFYRLRQIDRDGSYTYSDVVSAKLKIQENSIALFPNPAQDEVFIRLNKPENQSVNLRLFDISGRLVKEKVYSEDLINLSVSELVTGVYFVELAIGTHVFVEKLIVK